MAAKKRSKIEPGAVVQSTTVVVDFGEISDTVKPGDYGIVCDTDFKPEWFNVHWANGYLCTVAPSDVKGVPESKVARIVSQPNEDGKFACGECAKRRKAA